MKKIGESVKGSKNLLKGMILLMKNHPQAKFYEYLLLHGEQFSEVDRKKSERIRTERFCKPKECYYNAQLMALDFDMKYYEGYAVSGQLPLPVEHAWLVSNGRVIDITWHDLSKPDYFGLEIPKEFIQKHILNTEKAEQLLWLYITNKVKI
jgi:hypothetical protein